ncbi:hypothetical protein R1V99_01370, partial [Stenotrophomonas maltophilia]|nr:hypothetical protein [Stenotrophomonas maltophilia]
HRGHRPDRAGGRPEAGRWPGGASPNLPGDPTGGVNKAFGSVYKVRLKAKALRERSVVAYQLIKWGLVVAVIAGIWAL